MTYLCTTTLLFLQAFQALKQAFDEHDWLSEKYLETLDRSLAGEEFEEYLADNTAGA